MQTLFIGRRIERLDIVDSTNNYAANLLVGSGIHEGTVIIADYQTTGKGQRGNSWHSDAGENLMLSVILAPSFLTVSNQFNLSKVVALALADLLGEYQLENVRIKWPNDLLIGTRKIAGILIESTVRNNALKNSVVGVGLNVNQVVFPFGISATSMRLELQREFGLDRVLEKFCTVLERRYLQLRGGSGTIHEEYLDNLWGYRELIKVQEANGRLIEGKVLGVDESGKIIIQTANGEQSTYSLNEAKLLI